MNHQIKRCLDGAVIFEAECESVRACVKLAVKSGANLSGADLSGANLLGATIYLGKFKATFA